MLKVVFDSGHGCYKRGYDAVKLAQTGLLRAKVAWVAQVAVIASVARNAKIRPRCCQTALDLLIRQKATQTIKPLPTE